MTLILAVLANRPSACSRPVGIRWATERAIPSRRTSSTRSNARTNSGALAVWALTQPVEQRLVPALRDRQESFEFGSGFLRHCYGEHQPDSLLHPTAQPCYVPLQRGHGRQE